VETTEKAEATEMSVLAAIEWIVFIAVLIFWGAVIADWIVRDRKRAAMYERWAEEDARRAAYDKERRKQNPWTR